MKNRTGFRYSTFLIIGCALIIVTAVSVAIAQSNSAFNLNSPASFPVDI